MKQRQIEWPNIRQPYCPSEEQFGFFPPRLRYIACPLNSTFKQDRITSLKDKFEPVVASPSDRLKVFVEDMEVGKDYPCEFQGMTIVVRKEETGKVGIYEVLDGSNTS